MTHPLPERCVDREPGLVELCRTLPEIVGRACRVLDVLRLSRRVYRISLSSAGRSQSLIAKRLHSPVAHRVQLALERWLPGAELAHAGPALVGVSATPEASVVWHLYEDLGERTLEDAFATPTALDAAVRLVARIHARFAEESTLADWRVRGEDHGIAFYDSSLRDAISAVQAAIEGFDRHTAETARVERLHARLEALAQESVEVICALAELGGPDTLLHGDLWPRNTAVLPNRRTLDVRLLDWDRVGPGSFSYDLSTLALRVPGQHRARVVELYRREAGASGVRLPADSGMGFLFASAECARLASLATWVAHEVVERGSQWALEELAEIDGWLQRAQEQCVV